MSSRPRGCEKGHLAPRCVEQILFVEHQRAVGQHCPRESQQPQVKVRKIETHDEEGVPGRVRQQQHVVDVDEAAGPPHGLSLHELPDRLHLMSDGPLPWASKGSVRGVHR